MPDIIELRRALNTLMPERTTPKKRKAWEIVNEHCGLFFDLLRVLPFLSDEGKIVSSVDMNELEAEKIAKNLNALFKISTDDI